MANGGKEGIGLLCSALVRSHLEHCVQAWGPQHRKDVELLEQIQRRVVKIIRGLMEIGLLSLEERRVWEDIIVVL